MPGRGVLKARAPKSTNTESLGCISASGTSLQRYGKMMQIIHEQDTKGENIFLPWQAQKVQLQTSSKKIPTSRISPRKKDKIK